MSKVIVTISVEVSLSTFDALDFSPDKTCLPEDKAMLLSSPESVVDMVENYYFETIVIELLY